MALEAVFGVFLTAFFLDESVKLVVAIGGVRVIRQRCFRRAGGTATSRREEEAGSFP
jgi:hypothetical protein